MSEKIALHAARIAHTMSNEDRFSAISTVIMDAQEPLSTYIEASKIAIKAAAQNYAQMGWQISDTHTLAHVTLTKDGAITINGGIKLFEANHTHPETSVIVTLSNRTGADTIDTDLIGQSIKNRFDEHDIEVLHVVILKK